MTALRKGQPIVTTAGHGIGVQTIDWQTCVFVQTAKGFEPRPVTLGRTNEREIEVTWGLSAGERYVTQGAFTLKAELAKASLGGKDSR